MTFQTQVQANQAPAVEGDFASTNPRSTVLAGPGGLVVGELGAYVGRFAWVTEPDDGDGFPANVNNFGPGAPLGLIAREMQGIITTWLGTSTMFLQPGFQITVYDNVDMWVRNAGANIAIPGMMVFANSETGEATAAAVGSAPASGGTSTASTIAAATGSFEASIAGDVLTIVTVNSGTAVAGGTLSGTGVAPSLKIVEQLDGTPGGVGTYRVDIGSQTVAQTTISETYGLLTVGGTVTGAFEVNDKVTGSGVTDPTYITQQLSPTTFAVTPTQTVGSGTINVAAFTVTGWYVWTTAGAGELMKISRRKPNPVA